MAIWKNPIGRLVVLLFHAIVFVLAEGFSNIFVAFALELPPQDFAVTVNLFAFYFYIPVWLILITSLSLILVLFVGVGFALWSGLWTFLSNMAVLFFREKSVEMWKQIKESIIYFHLMGAIICILYFALVSDLFIKGQEFLIPVARLSAYAFDYQRSQLYPCIEKKERMRLHENGVITVATLQSNQFSCLINNCVIIRVDYYEQCQSAKIRKNNRD